MTTPRLAADHSRDDLAFQFMLVIAANTALSPQEAVDRSYALADAFQSRANPRNTRPEATELLRHLVGDPAVPATPGKPFDTSLGNEIPF